MQCWMDYSVQFPDGKPVYADQARQLVARLNSQRNWVPREIFHHAEDGRLLTGLSPYRFGGGRRALHIYAIGDAAVDTLDGCAHKITRLLGEHFGRPLPETRRTGRFALRVQRPQQYEVPILVWQRKKKELVRFEADTRANRVTRAICEKINDKIASSITRQIDFLELDAGDAPWRVDDVSIRGTEHIRPYLPVPLHQGFLLSARNVTFRTNLDLDNGPWHVGHLTSKGYGRVRLARAA